MKKREIFEYVVAISGKVFVSVAEFWGCAEPVNIEFSNTHKRIFTDIEVARTVAKAVDGKVFIQKTTIIEYEELPKAK